MKSNQTLKLALIGITVLLNACSGGNGRETTTTIQCPRVYSPTNMNLPANEKTKVVELTALNSLPPGTYVETSASLYYEDPNFAPDNNFRIEVRDTSSVDEKTKTRSYKATPYCFRNSRADLQNVGMSVDGISKLVITAGAPADAEARTFSFNINNIGKVTPDSKARSKPESAEKVYEPAEHTFVYKRSATEIEIRSKGQVTTSAGQTGTYYLSVILTKQP